MSALDQIIVCHLENGDTTYLAQQLSGDNWRIVMQALDKLDTSPTKTMKQLRMDMICIMDILYWSEVND